MTDSTATERVGRYQLLEPIGAGPTGTVSRAKVFGVAGFERQFAVKRFLPEVAATGPAAQALSAAARAYGNLEHPRIARMTEFGVSHGTTFTAVEFVVGIDALRLITEARLAGVTLAAGGALALVSQAARAVGYAHGRGISHLGLAPTNVIVTADGDVKITDFAVLAATLPTRPVDSPRLAQRIGYLAPEQIAGEATSAATDVFALGVLAYELITSKRAFEGDTPTRVAQAVVTGPPAELPLPRPIVRVVQRCLARSPFERFPDARALADALDAALRVAPVPGSRKEVGVVVKDLVDRLATLRDGQMSGMLALDVGTGPLRRGPTSDPLSQLDIDDEGRTNDDALSRAPTNVATSGLAIGADVTQPDMPRPMTTVTGVAPPPIPVPQGIAMATTPALPTIPLPGASTTLPGVSRERAVASVTGSGMQIPTIRPRARSSQGAVARAPTPPPTTPLVEALEAAVPPATEDEPTVERAPELPAPSMEPEPPTLRSSPASIDLHSDRAAPLAAIQDADSKPTARNEPAPRPPPLEPRRPTPPPMPPMRRAPTPPSLFAVSPAGEQVIADATERARTTVDVRTDPGLGVRPTASSMAVASSLEVHDIPTGTMPPLLVEQLNQAVRAESEAEITVIPASAGVDAAVSAAIDAIDAEDLAPPPPGSGVVPLVMDNPNAVVERVEVPAPRAPRIATQPKIAVPAVREETVVSARGSRAPVVVALLVILLGAGGAAAWQLGVFDRGVGEQADVPRVDAAAPIASRDAASVVAVADAAPVVADAGALIAVADAAPVVAADAAVVAVAAPDARAGSAAGIGSGSGTGSAGSGAGSGAGSAVQAAVQTTPGTDLAIHSTPAGAHAFLDGVDAGATPVARPGTADRHTLVLYAPGYDLYVGKVDGRGTLDIALPAAPATTGEAGIKVIHCKDKDRYYVYVDGKPAGQTCPTEQRINCAVGAHLVEVYDAQTDKKRSWNVTVTDTRLSFRVRVDPD